MEIKIKDKTVTVDDPKKVARILTEILNAENDMDQDKEHLWATYFNNRNQIKCIELVSLGTLNASLVHPRELLRPAIKRACTSFIMAHNHPSGNPEPSEADLSATRRMKEAAELMGICLLDSIIISGGKDFYSFREHNTL